MEASAQPLRHSDVQQLGLLELAYLGDTVCDLYVRERLVRRGIGVRDMHARAVAQVNAQSQAEALTRVLPLLSETEAAVVRRGRNAKAHHAAPHGVQHRVYGQSTAFEALLGYLYLTGQSDRLNQILSTALEDPA